jgi:hypothetical protein
MESVGQKLREARVRAGLSLEEISADTRLSLKKLCAIEADDLSRISSPFFYRSFVRQFAARVKLDYDNIAEAVQEAARTIPEPLMPGQEEPQNIRVPAVKRPGQMNLRWVRPVISFCLVLIACSGAYAVWQNSHGEWRVVLGQLNSRLTDVKMHFTEAQPEAKSAVRLSSVPKAHSAPRETGFRVQLSALERTWLSIVADGKQVFSGELDAPQTKALEGHESARIRTGNAGGLRVTFNGKEIGVLGPRGQVRTVVFTKDDYRVLAPAPQVAFNAFLQNVEY